jgi:hypothetical protein
MANVPLSSISAAGLFSADFSCLRGAWRDVVAELLQRRFSGAEALKA